MTKTSRRMKSEAESPGHWLKAGAAQHMANAFGSRAAEIRVCCSVSPSLQGLRYSRVFCCKQSGTTSRRLCQEPAAFLHPEIG